MGNLRIAVLRLPAQFMEKELIKFKKIRVRKSSYELFLEMATRIRLLLIGKNQEFGKLDKELMEYLQDALEICETLVTCVVKKHLTEGMETRRSVELEKFLDLLDKLIAADVLTLNGGKRTA